jgi:hypothetical protein
MKTNTCVVLLGPALTAVSGVSTHLNQLFSSRQAERYELLHFQVSSVGRKEPALGKVRHSLGVRSRTIALIRDVVHYS